MARGDQTIPVPFDFGDARAAIRALNAELKATEKQIADLVRKGQAVDPQLTRRLSDLRRMEAQQKAIIQTNKELKATGREARHIVHDIHALAASGALKNLAEGKFTAGDAANLALVFRRDLAKAVGKVFGPNARGMAMASLPVIGTMIQAVQSIKEGVKEYREGREALGETSSGRLTIGERTLLRKELSNYWNNTADAKAVLSDSEAIAKGISGMDREELARLRGPGGAALGQTLAYHVEEGIKKQEKALGRHLDSKEQEIITRDVIARMMQEENFKRMAPQYKEMLDKALQKKDIDVMKMKTSAQLWEEREKQQRETVLWDQRRRRVPSLLLD